MNRRKLSASAAAAAALLGIFGLAALAVSGATAGPTASPPTAQTSAANVDAAIRAVRTARGAVGGRPYDIERERLGGRRVWEVKLARAKGRPREVLVSANGRKVIQRGRTGRSEEAALARQAKVGLVAAIRKAARRAGGHLEDADIDRRRGQVVWEVTFHGRFETDVYISLVNGSVVGVDRDDD